MKKKERDSVLKGMGTPLARRTKGSKDKSGGESSTDASVTPALEEVSEAPEEELQEEIVVDVQKEKQEAEARRLADEARAHQEAHFTLKHLHHLEKGDDRILMLFMQFINIDEEHWKDFWSRFRPDGTMVIEEFEKYVHWERRWTGQTKLVFSLLDEHERGFITNTRLLELKRWIQRYKDKSDTDIVKFRRRLSQLYGNLGRAWRLGLDPDQNGKCCFNQFCRFCHDHGMTKDLRTLWGDLTEGDFNRTIHFRDLDPDGDMTIQMFANSLALHGGTLLKGWQQIILTGGGHLHRDSFITQCAMWGVDMKTAKWLFAVLDPNGTRYLTEYDDLIFLRSYDPGPMTVEACRGTFASKKDQSKEEQFDLVVEMTAEEYDEYQEMLRAKQMIAGIDVDSEEKGKERMQRLRSAAQEQRAQYQAEERAHACRHTWPVREVNSDDEMFGSPAVSPGSPRK